MLGRRFWSLGKGRRAYNFEGFYEIICLEGGFWLVERVGAHIILKDFEKLYAWKVDFGLRKG